MELHTYYALNGNTLIYDYDKDSLLSGGVEISLELLKDTLRVRADRFRIQSPKTKDITQLQQLFTYKHQFKGLEAGKYELMVSLQDVNDTAQPYSFKQPITIRPLYEGTQTSDFLMVEANNLSQLESPTKSGSNLVPKVTSGSYFYSEGSDKLTFFIELYNLQKKLDSTNAYLLKYYVKDMRLNRPINKFAAFKKMTATPVAMFMASFDISNLPTGNYNLVIEAINPKGEEIVKREQFFYRSNPSIAIDITEYTEEDLQGTFVSNYYNFDSVYQYIEYLYPISTDSERRAQRIILKGRKLEDMRRYFYSFWVNKSSLQPEEEWNKYHADVILVNKKYSTPIQKGYMSDRGRIYLTYGKPTLIYSRPFEPSLPPYEQWQYDRIDSPYTIPQINKQFIFAEFDISTNDYQLIHSNATGELFNRRWQYDLANGAFGTGNVDDNSIPINNQGSRVNDGVIFNTGSGSNR